MPHYVQQKCIKSLIMMINLEGKNKITIIKFKSVFCHCKTIGCQSISRNFKIV